MPLTHHRLRSTFASGLGCVLLWTTISAFGNVIEIQPLDVVPRAGTQAQVDLILGHIGKQDYDAALKLATEMTRKTPGDAVGYDLQGMAYFGKDDFANARRSFEKALEIASGDKQAMFYLAQLDIHERYTAPRTRARAKGGVTGPEEHRDCLSPGRGTGALGRPGSRTQATRGFAC